MPLDAPAIEPKPETPAADLTYLRAGGGWRNRGAWFGLRGCIVAFPIEPVIYDLLVTMPKGIKRVQVKTATHLSKDGWQVTGRPAAVLGRQSRKAASSRPGNN